MKAVFVYAVLIVASVVAAPATNDDDTPVAPQPKKCQEFCTYELNPVCGYDGACYHSYSNKCIYDLEKCGKKNSLETVDTSLCDLAGKNNHPDYKLCNA